MGMEKERKPYRVTTVTNTPNPNYVRGSQHRNRRNPDIESRSEVFFDTLEAAQDYRARVGGCVYALSASGKSYRTAGDGK